MIVLEKHTIQPGQFTVAKAPAIISTVLGSCVSVCLWDKVSKIGGMNHYLLPGTDHEDAGNANRGITATPLLIRSLLNRNCKIENLEAKVFGGCNSLYRKDDIFRVGERNIEMAFKILEEYNIPVAAHDVGGIYGRKIVFNLATGKVRMRLLVKAGNELNEEDNKGFSNR
jgi:chemotaxis protein CheD